MPRHRPSHPSDRRKKGPRPVDKKEGRIKAWKRSEDIPLDEEDEFELSRDRILLEGEEEDDENFGDEDEVFALKGLASSSEDGDESDRDEENPSLNGKVSKVPSKMKTSLPQKKSNKDAPSTSSSGSESEEEGWGNKRGTYYSSNAAQLDSDDEEGNALEEQEARRLQGKQRESMTEDDFGIAEASQAAAETEQASINDHAMFDPPLEAAPLNADKQTLLKHLEKTSPETIALALEWDDVSEAIVRAEAKIKDMQAADIIYPGKLGMFQLYHHSLLTYASVIAFYLYLRASPKYASHPELLRSHPIMERLLTLKQGISQLEAFSSDTVNSAAVAGSFDEDGLGQDAEALWSAERLRAMSEEEIDALIAEHEEAATIRAALSGSMPKAKSKSKVQPLKKAAKKAAAQEKGMPKGPVFDLQEPDYTEEGEKDPKVSAASEDPFGEATALDEVDAADKKARKKSLRFHTARIENVSNRRQNARTATGGDDDIPYRERRREQELKGKRVHGGAQGEDLNAAEPEPELQSEPRKRQRAEESEDDGSGDDEYYDLVKRQKKERQEEKKVAYDAAKAAERGDIAEDVVNGQRTISRAILANKGLTPRRAKSVRNPRVKKRLRYEKAKRKVSSQKAVYKGGIGDVNRYDGERTGITKVIKSVRF